MAQNFTTFKWFDIIRTVMKAIRPLPALLAAGFLCAFQTAWPGVDSRPRVVASIFPLAEFARGVAGERAEVTLFLPPGAEIHTWQPSPRQILSLNRAQVFFYVGGRLEPWAREVLKSRPLSGPRVLEAGLGVRLLDNDPHFWLDFELDALLVERLGVVLAEVDPEGSALYRKNAEAYAKRLRALDQKFRAGLDSCSQRTMVVGGHAAFGYLAARYGLEQVSLYGLSPDSEPTPRHLLEVTDLVKKRHIRAVFFEATVNPKLAWVLAKETGAEALALSDGASLTAEQSRSGRTFFDIMEDNLANLRRGLGCR